MNNMNDHDRHDLKARDIDEREWQAQERALQAERLHLGDTDPRLASYRAIARALRQPLPHGLPADFARQLAARLGRAPLDTRVEQTLLRALLTLLALSGAVVVMVLIVNQNGLAQTHNLKALRRLFHRVHATPAHPDCSLCRA